MSRCECDFCNDPRVLLAVVKQGCELGTRYSTIRLWSRRALLAPNALFFVSLWHDGWALWLTAAALMCLAFAAAEWSGWKVKRTRFYVDSAVERLREKGVWND